MSKELSYIEALQQMVLEQQRTIIQMRELLMDIWIGNDHYDEEFLYSASTPEHDWIDKREQLIKKSGEKIERE
tara:strand:+ start:480 stop:698 length:219 start_codon:yes stop_codon:yes gene_type:complete